ncbi:hypothetical protein FA95DRAFT_1597005 [Auriscalpium vulgare]|uniref:Uncharacterized protein n=1 Tax=Auriscalpium vulgare TaxID=40419 RepID=A0ACB8RNS8_9AGAM|nr:hypothetical protein FA95DRAFT_1597005 [Auriscalpium vulgare]
MQRWPLPHSGKNINMSNPKPHPSIPGPNFCSPGPNSGSPHYKNGSLQPLGPQSHQQL